MEQAVGARRIDRLRGEDARQHRARDPGHAMTGEHVERVVDLDLRT